MTNTIKNNPSGQVPCDKAFSQNIWSGMMFGLGIVAFIDEAVFHQLLHWHHFYDKSTSAVGLVSDGFFHALSWFSTVWSLFMVANLRRRISWQPMLWVGGVFLGAGGFQLYDGVVQHKLMKLHQIRYYVVILPYDLVWIITALIMLIVGIFLVVRARNTFKQAGAELENAGKY